MRSKLILRFLILAALIATQVVSSQANAGVPGRASVRASTAATPARSLAQARGKRKRRPAPTPAAAPAPAPEEAAPEEVAEEVPEAEPVPAPPPPPEAAPVAAPEVTAPAPDRPDLSALKERYDRLRDAVFRSRARRETLEKALFSTKMTTVIQWESNRHYRLDRAEVRLDGARLWESGESPVGEDPIPLAEKSVPPGAHVLAVRIEVHSRDNPTLGYVSEQSFSLTLPEGKKTRVKITLEEDGDLPSYNPDIDVDVELDD